MWSAADENPYGMELYEFIYRTGYVLYRNTRRIDFRTTVDYHEQHQLLKVAFPVDIRSTFGTIWMCNMEM